ncbi:MAG: protein kinase domain-containing protein, partial [Kofleriaceae bacterium]
MTAACLDDELVLGLVEGRLAPPVLASVDDHLDGCASCRELVVQLSRARTTTQVLERGSQLGRYVIGELLGAGAMGRVYSAWQPELDRRVAIKVLQEDGPGGRERLVREAQAMARLDHPNVVGVYEVGSTDGGVYVVMDLVEGETLRAWAERRRPWRDVVRVLIETARGIAAVHAAGVVHRDVKPDNVIVGADGRARLGDFGLARSGAGANSAPVASAVGARRAPAVPGDGARSTPVVLGDGARSAPAVPGAGAGSTPPAPGDGARSAPAVPGAGARSAPAVPGDAARSAPVVPGDGAGSTRPALAVGTPATAIAGTPAYMAPEVLRGGPAGEASDQFGFGITAYEVLAGAGPVAGRTRGERKRAIERGALPPQPG